MDESKRSSASTTPSGTRGSSIAGAGSGMVETGALQSASAQVGSAASTAGPLMGRIRDTATKQLTTQKDRATEGIGSVVQAVRQSTQQLRSEQHDTVANYIERAADQIESLSEKLKQKDVGELLADAQRLARRQPALFIGSAFAIGLLGARFLKSSSERGQQYDGGNEYPFATPRAYSGTARVDASEFPRTERF